MIRASVIFAVILLAGSLANGYAETYTWTDEQGTIHFTEDLGKVPQAIREKARSGEAIEPVPAESPALPPPAAKDPDLAPKAKPSAGTDEVNSSDLYDGKTYAQWEKELAEREAAMTAKRKRLDEIVATLNSSASNVANQKKLVEEHKALLAEFKVLKTQYFQQVELARKAGLQINIQQ
jgi:hypothetical protein